MPEATGRAESFAFYRAGLSAALFLDREGQDRLLDIDADAAWRSYGAEMHPAIRFDLVLKNLAMLYPGAFAPGPVFQLPGWYDDDPWGVGFDRPPRDELAALLRKREPPADAKAALQLARDSWNIAPPAPSTLTTNLTPASQLVVAGGRALSTVTEVFRSRAGHQVRTQVLLVSDAPGVRHLLGIAAALGREAGVPRMIGAFARPADAQAAAEKQGMTGASLLVTSGDASAAERASAVGLADAWGVRERVEV